MNATEQFFEQLARERTVPLLGKVHGRARFDLVHREDGDHDGEATASAAEQAEQADHWLIAIDNGAVTVSHGHEHADSTVRTDHRLFDRLVRGEENAVAAVLRGAITCTGDVELLLAIQRLFPGPPHQHDPSTAGGSDA